MTCKYEMGITYPILQGPIGSVATVDLAAAVSNAGGMGSLALTWTTAELARQQVTELRRRTNKPFFVNFVLSFESKALIAALESGAPMVTFAWGLPGDLVRTVHSFGARVGIQVGTVQGAKRAVEQGCDFLICQGVEAGGHVQSSIPLRQLLAEVLASEKAVPVVAAGGITTGKDIAELLNMGAAAVTLGTRFVASNESGAHPSYKEALVQASRSDAVLTGCFDGGWPYALHRILRNTTLNRWEEAGCPPVGFRPGEGEIIATTISGVKIRRYDSASATEGMHGDPSACCLYAGQGVGDINGILPAATIVHRLGEEARTTD